MKKFHASEIMFLAGCIVMAMFIGGCQQNQADNPTQTSPNSVIEPIDYGNGVLYFPIGGKSFAVSLAVYIGRGSNEVVSVSSDNRGIDGFTIGYFVVTRPKK